jgi:23S rRNA (cytosine1962-C5)-methyltransferase
VERIAFKLKSKAEKAIKQGHPWVYESAIVKQSNPGEAGDLAIMYDQRKNKVMAIGLYDPDSPIRIKVISNEGPQLIDLSFWMGKLRSALEVRRPLLESDTNSYRLVHGENDGLPSLVIDIYAEVAVCKIYSRIWIPYLDQIYAALEEVIAPKTIVLRLSRQVKELSSLTDGEVVLGSLSNPIVVFKEHGIHFSAHVIEGHKTGYFLDHRENRRRVGKMSAGKRVLDVFSYAGGFSVHAAAGGAVAVTSIDISAKALEVAQYNISLNEHHAKHFTMAIDAFEGLEKLLHERKMYEIVIVDPPSFAKKEEEVAGALRSYKRLAKQAARLVAPKGTLILASCSSRVKAADFFEVSTQGIAQSGRTFKMLDQTYHDIDHPINFPQGAYLKCAYFVLD